MHFPGKGVCLHIFKTRTSLLLKTTPGFELADLASLHAPPGNFVEA